MTDEPRPDADGLEWQDLARALRKVPPRYDSGRAWVELERTIDESTPAVAVQASPDHPGVQRKAALRPRLGATNWLARIAAILAFGGAISLAWRTMRPALEAPGPAAMREVATAPGQRATIRLVDGTRVELGVDSRLRYSPTLGRAGREVQLEGEAYFDVVHDDRHPFVVHTARAVVRDLGTRFNVRSYADVPVVEVVVAEGAVAIAPETRHAPRDSLLLRAGDLGRVEADGQLVAQRGIDVEAHLSWIEGRLQFVDVPLREAVPRLARWYGVDIRLADTTIASRRYTASLQNDPLPQLLELMALALQIRVERVGDGFVLRGKSDRNLPTTAH